MAFYQEILLNKYSQNPYRLYIPIKNDECVEEEREYFSVHIIAVSDCVVVLEAYARIIIIDDDGKQFLAHFSAQLNLFSGKCSHRNFNLPFSSQDLTGEC